MKKVTAMMIGFICITLLGACSSDDVKEKFVPQALGLLVYGEEDNVINAIEENEDALVNHAEWQVKQVRSENEKEVLVISDSDAKAMLDEKLWNKVVKEDKTDTLSQLPKADDDSSLLFTKDTSIQTLDVAGITSNNEGNVVLGNSRTMTDMYMIVPDQIWDNLKGDVLTIGFMHFHKDENPKHKINNFPDIETVQLIDVN